MAKTTESIDGVFAFSDLSAETQSLVERVHETKRPLVITKNGEHTAVLVDAEQYELQQRRLILMERIERGRRDIAEGRSHTQERVIYAPMPTQVRSSRSSTAAATRRPGYHRRVAEERPGGDEPENSGEMVFSGTERVRDAG